MRLIDADRLINELKNMSFTIMGLRSGEKLLTEQIQTVLNAVYYKVEAQPTVYLVRCDECEYFTRKNLPTDFSKGRCSSLGGYVHPDNLCRYGIKEEISEEVHCKDCKYRMWSDHYAECGKGYKGIVYPDDTCGRGVKNDSSMR